MGSRVPVVLTAAVAALAAGAASASAGTPGKRARLDLTIQTQKITVVDTGPAGASPGDIVLEADALTRAGKAFGTAQITCIAHAGDLLNGSAECTGTFYLPKGQLETQGGARSMNGAISGAGAVTGGTGRYHGVRGSYAFRTTSAASRSIRFKLIR
jgi:hypothetical protein